MYYLYKQGVIPEMPLLDKRMRIVKRRPNPFVANMNSMELGRKRYWYFGFMTFLFRGFARVFEEYDVVMDNRILSKAVLISKVPLYRFLPSKGIHVCYCETIPEARGKGLYPLLLTYVQNVHLQHDLYMIVEESNHASIKGIEKAGFVRYALGERLSNGYFIETTRL